MPFILVKEESSDDLKELDFSKLLIPSYLGKFDLIEQSIRYATNQQPIL